MEAKKVMFFLGFVMFYIIIVGALVYSEGSPDYTPKKVFLSSPINDIISNFSGVDWSFPTTIASTTYYSQSEVIDTSNYFINVTPARMLSPGYVTIDFLSKNYSGKAYVILGIDDSPLNISFEYWDFDKQEWVVLDKKPKKLDKILNGKIKWHKSAGDMQIDLNELNRVRVFIGQEYFVENIKEIKYDFAFYPKSYDENFELAYNEGWFYFIDPWVIVANDPTNVGTLAFNTGLFYNGSKFYYVHRPSGTDYVIKNATNQTNWQDFYTLNTSSYETSYGEIMVLSADRIALIYSNAQDAGGGNRHKQVMFDIINSSGQMTNRTMLYNVTMSGSLYRVFDGCADDAGNLYIITYPQADWNNRVFKYNSTNQLAQTFTLGTMTNSNLQGYGFSCLVDADNRVWAFYVNGSVVSATSPVWEVFNSDGSINISLKNASGYVATRYMGRTSMAANGNIWLLYSSTPSNNLTVAYINKTTGLVMDDMQMPTFSYTGNGNSIVADRTNSSLAYLLYTQTAFGQFYKMTLGFNGTDIVNVSSETYISNGDMGHQLRFADQNYPSSMNGDGQAPYYYTFMNGTSAPFAMSVMLESFNVTGQTNVSSCGYVNNNTLLVNSLQNTGSNHCLIINMSNIEIDCAGYSISGIAPNTDASAVYGNSFSNLTIKNCYFYNEVNGILLENFSDVIIENTTIRNLLSRGIGVLTGDNILVKNSSISNATEGGAGLGLDFQNVENSSIINNTLFDNICFDVAVWGVSRNVSVENNLVYQKYKTVNCVSSYRNAIYFNNTNIARVYNNIVENLTSNDNSVGINSQYSDNTYFVNNTVRNYAGQNAVQMVFGENYTITDNKIFGVNDGFVYYITGGLNLSNNNVTNANICIYNDNSGDCSGDVYLNNYVQNCSMGYYFENAYNNYFNDSWIVSSRNKAFNFTGTSYNNNFINTSLNTSAMFVSGTSNATVNWWLNVFVTNGSAVNNSYVNVTDKTGLKVYENYTLESGYIPNLKLLKELQINSTATLFLTNYTVNAVKNAQNGSASVNLTSSQTITITLGGGEAEVFGFTITLPGSLSVNSSISQPNPSAGIEFNFSSSTQSQKEPCVKSNGLCQNSTTPIFVLNNYGTSALNYSVYMNASLPSAFTLRINDEYVYGASLTVSTSALTINDSIPTSNSINLWLWADCTNCAVADQTSKTLMHSGMNVTGG